MEKITMILEKIGLPFAYDHFAEGESPNPPFICYLIPNSDNFSADGIVYHEIEDIDIELYCDKKDPITEKKIADFLTANKIYYEKQETYIESEKMILVIFEI